MEDPWCHRTWLRLMINWHLPLFDLNHILISLSAHKVPFHSTMLFLNFQFQTEWRTLCHHLYDWQSPKSVSSQEQISPSLHVFFFQFLIWSQVAASPLDCEQVEKTKKIFCLERYLILEPLVEDQRCWCDRHLWYSWLLSAENTTDELSAYLNR